MSNGNTKKDAGVLQNTCHPERGTTEGSATAQRISYRFPHPLARIRNDNTRHIINFKTLKNVNELHNIRKSNAPPLVRGKPFSRQKTKGKRQKLRSAMPVEIPIESVPTGKWEASGAKVKSQKETTLSFELSTLNLMSRGWPLLYYSLKSLDCRRDDSDCKANRPSQFVMKTSVAHCAHPANIEVAGQLTETAEQKCTGHCRAIQLDLNKGRSQVLHRFNPFSGDSCFSSAVGRTSSLADLS